MVDPFSTASQERRSSAGASCSACRGCERLRDRWHWQEGWLSTIAAEPSRHEREAGAGTPRGFTAKLAGRGHNGRVRALAVTAAVVAALFAGPAAAGPAGFRATVSRLEAAQRQRMTGVSWQPGCPVSLADLRLLTLTYHGFDGGPHTGRLVVHRDAAAALVGVFRRLYAAGFPIRRMRPVDAYGDSDFRSIEADNSSAFNCRRVEGT